MIVSQSWPGYDLTRRASKITSLVEQWEPERCFVLSD
jgi:hypothetical protein